MVNAGVKRVGGWVTFFFPSGYEPEIHLLSTCISSDPFSRSVLGILEGTGSVSAGGDHAAHSLCAARRACGFVYKSDLVCLVSKGYVG